MAHRTFVELRASGLTEAWEQVSGTATAPIDMVRSLGLTLVELAGTGLEEDDRRLLERLDAGTDAG